MMPSRCCIQYVTKSGRPSNGHRTRKDQSSSQFPRRVVLKNVLTTGQFHSFPMLVRSCLKSCMLGFSMGFPGGSDNKESACNAGDLSSIPGSERSSGEGNGNPLQYSCLENTMDREPGWLQSMGSQSWTRLKD